MQPTIRIDAEVFAALKERAEPLVDTANDVLRREFGLDDVAESSAKPTMSGRAPAGSLLPERDYEIPLLESLEELGGSAPTSVVLERLGEKLSDRFTELDLEQYGKSGYMRWKNRAQFVRHSLVKKGELAADSPRGIWQITKAGRGRLRSRKGS